VEGSLWPAPALAVGLAAAGKRVAARVAWSRGEGRRSTNLYN
jgi:hypothetical protein